MGLDSPSLAKIKMVIFDVDGVLTDCRTWLDSDGEWKRFFSIRDGYGIRRLMEAGFQTGVITGSKAKDIQQRVKHLGITYFYEGSLDKTPAFEEILKKAGLHEKEIAYVGDDYFDIPILNRVGFAATVPEAMEEVKAHSHFIAQRPGGNGAVREICEFLMKSQGKQQKVFK